MSSLDQPNAEIAERESRRRQREPFYTPLDMAAFAAIVVMIWGPLLASVLRQ